MFHFLHTLAGFLCSIEEYGKKNPGPEKYGKKKLGSGDVFVFPDVFATKS